MLPHALRAWMQHTAGASLNLLHDPQTWTRPLVQTTFPVPVQARWCALWETAEELLGVLEQFPQTLCHNDPISGNLFSRLTPDGHDTTVAIDWGFLSVGAIGQDLGTLLSGDLLSGVITARDMPEYEALAIPKYLEGLEMTGWTMPVEHLRFAYATTAALKHGTFWAVMTRLSLLGDEPPPWVDHFAAQHGWSSAVALERWGEGLYYLLDLADEARLAAKHLLT